MQPYHLDDDGRWAAKRIRPDLIRTTYAFRSLLDAGERGTLKPGYRADLVVLDRDPTRIPPVSLDQARLKMTVAGGRVVFEP